MFHTENPGLSIEYKTCYLKLKLQSMFHGRPVGLWMLLHLYVIPASVLGSVSSSSSSASTSTTFYHPRRLVTAHQTTPQEHKTRCGKSDRGDVTATGQGQFLILYLLGLYSNMDSVNLENIFRGLRFFTAGTVGALNARRLSANPETSSSSGANAADRDHLHNRCSPILPPDPLVSRYPSTSLVRPNPCPPVLYSLLPITKRACPLTPHCRFVLPVHQLSYPTMAP